MESRADKSFYPPAAFSFSVLFENGLTVEFQEVSGLHPSLQSESDPSEGENSFRLKLPEHTFHASVTLKRAILDDDPRFRSIAEQSFDQPVSKTTIAITLLDQAAKPLRVWTLHNAWPVKLSVADFQPDSGQIAVESMELAYEALVESAPT